MAASLPPVPASLKSVKEYLKVATEHDKRDPVVSYYCRLYAFQRGLEIDKKSPEARALLTALMDLLENGKKDMADTEAITSEVVGQAHVENYALQLFRYADNEDRAARFGMNVVKAFNTSGRLFDVLSQFGDLSEDIEKIKKYSKFKALYLLMCMKNGETPKPGPLEDEEDPGFSEESSGAVPGGSQPADIGFASSQPGPSQPSNPYVPPTQPSPYDPTAGLPSVPSSHHTPHTPANQPAPQNHPYPAPANPEPASGAAYSGTVPWQPPSNPGNVKLSVQDYQRATKLCRFATSAMQYEDSKTAIDNLMKALNLLTTGKES